MYKYDNTYSSSLTVVYEWTNASVKYSFNCKTRHCIFQLELKANVLMVFENTYDRDDDNEHDDDYDNGDDENDYGNDQKWLICMTLSGEN